MKKKLVKISTFLVIILLFIKITVLGQTTVSGEVSGTWTKEKSPYILSGDVTIPAGKSLTMQPGVLIEVPNYSTDIVVYGTLVAQGSSTDSIYIKGKAIPNNSISTHGGSIIFKQGSSPSILDFISISQMGDSWSFGTAIEIEKNASPTIKNTSIRNSENYDIYSWPGGVINFSKIKALVSLSGGEVQMVAIIPNLGNKGSIYELLGDLTIPKDGRLTVASGVTIEVPNYSTDIIVNGSLLAQGSESNPISIIGKEIPNNTISSHGGTIFFNSGGSSSVLEYTLISQMGDTWTNGRAVEINNNNVRISNCKISNSEDIGIYNNSENLIIASTSIFGNFTGIYNAFGKPTLNDNKIFSNNNFGINNKGIENIDAKNTYWGDPTGPYHSSLNPKGKGNKVSDKVLFTPWIEQITKVNQTINFSEIGNKYVDDTLFLNATSTSTLPISYSIETLPVNGVAALSENRITFLGQEGKIIVTAQNSGNQFFLPAEIKQTFTVSKRNQTIYFPAIPNAVISDSSIILSGSSSSGLKISFRIISGSATLNENTLSFNSAGNVTVEAFQPGNKIYNPATSIFHTFKIESELKKPDLFIEKVDLQLSTINAGENFSYELSIKNNGGTTAPKGVLIRGYLSLDNKIDGSDILFAEDSITVPISSGQTQTFTKQAQAPDKINTYNLLFWVNPDATFGEISYSNNISKPIILNIRPGYTANANVESNYFTQGSKIPIIGQAIFNNGRPAINVPVEVYIINQGIRRIVLGKTDNNGSFSVSFSPLEKESGHFQIGACFPGQNLKTENDSFDILGVRVNNANSIIFNVIQNKTIEGYLEVKNLSDRTLKNFTINPLSLPDGASFKFKVIPLLEGNSTDSIGYTITGTNPTKGNNYLETEFQAKSDEGLIQKIVSNYFCKYAKGNLITEISNLKANVSKSSESRSFEVKLFNNGSASTGRISIDLPKVNWISSTTSINLSPLEPGDSTTIILKFKTTDEISVNSQINGKIGINSENGNSLSLPFTYQIVSQTTGIASITATNQYTYNTNNGKGPNLKDASVKISNLFTDEVYSSGLTNDKGNFSSIPIPEGKYRLVVEKEKHISYDNIIMINPGDTTKTIAFLDFQAITFNWNVVPSNVQDEYETVLEAKFETNVPLPVVTIEMPNEMPELSVGQEFQFMVTLTNHGLITAKEVSLNLPISDNEYEFITSYYPADLLAKQSIQIPVIMRKKKNNGGRFLVNSTGISCTEFVGVIYNYLCNNQKIWVRNGVLIKYIGRSCPSGGCTNCFPLGGFATGGIVVPPPAIIKKNNCIPCMSDIAGAIIGCLPYTEIPQLLFCYSVAIIDESKVDKGYELIKCAVEGGISLVPVAGCVANVGAAIVTCYEKLKKGRIKRELPNSFLKEISENLNEVKNGFTAFNAWMVEYFGNITEKDGWRVLYPLVQPFLTDVKVIPAENQKNIILEMQGFDISSASLNTFFLRWNTSIEAYAKGIESPNSEYPKIINWKVVNENILTMVRSHNYSVKKGFKTIDDMYKKSIMSLEEIINGEQNGVCASVTVQFNQQITMTREAFEGTLEIFNGHPSEAIKNISAKIEIRDENGTLSNHLFEIQPQNPGLLSIINSNGKGNIKFQFIPLINAAPESSKVYLFGGSITYLDPFTSTSITIPLNKVSITVNPSPNLKLHYFMQRNILGDDALTLDEVEPSVPAELAVMVENHGYGVARDFKISSAQPEIVENEKGLLIDFNIVGSNLQGNPKQLGLTNINFGDINPLKTIIGQWYFTSSLLGKFVSYDAKVVHKNSYGNKDLSLIQSVQLHELTKSIEAYGELEDGISDFLVNDVFDVNDKPDIIYFSQGKKTAKVSQAISGSFNLPLSGSTFTNILTITPSESGYNYISLPDPGNKLYEIVSVVRNDGQVIPNKNVWLTNVTLPVSQSPIYENKFHIVDNFTSKSPGLYTIKWNRKNLNTPTIQKIVGAPEKVTSKQVKSLKVQFVNKIDPSTFTIEDLSLSLQGGSNMINSSVRIFTLDSITFNIDLSSITTGNGLYVFTVQASEIKDTNGFSGYGGKQVSWPQFLTGLQIVGLSASYCNNSNNVELIGIPAGGIFSGKGVTGKIFDPKTAGTGQHIITYKKDGQLVNDTVLISLAPILKIVTNSTTLSCIQPNINIFAQTGDTTSILVYNFSGPGLNQISKKNNAVLSTPGTYTVKVKNTFGCSTIDSVVVNENINFEKIVLTEQPDSVYFINQGSTFNIKIAAKGSNLKYQWFKDGKPLIGNTNDILEIISVSPSNDGVYFCEVTGDCGKVTSNPFTLKINSIAQILETFPTKTDFKFEVYPNPTEIDKVWININGTNNQEVEIKIFDLTGKVFLEKKLICLGNDYKIPIDLENTPLGILLIHIKAGNNSMAKFLVRY